MTDKVTAMQAACKKKRSFFTQREANIIARRHNQRVYECPVCHCWHTTSKDFWGGSNRCSELEGHPSPNGRLNDE